MGRGAALPPLRGDGVDLVHEDDRRRVVDALAEDLAKVRFRFAVDSADDVRAVDVKKARIYLVRHGAREIGLTRSRRSAQNYAPGRPDAQLTIREWEPQPHRDHLPHH